eukprot:207778_1
MHISSFLYVLIVFITSNMVYYNTNEIYSSTVKHMSVQEGSIYAKSQKLRTVKKYSTLCFGWTNGDVFCCSIAFNSHTSMHAAISVIDIDGIWNQDRMLYALITYFLDSLLSSFIHCFVDPMRTSSAWLCTHQME